MSILSKLIILFLFISIVPVVVCGFLIVSTYEERAAFLEPYLRYPAKKVMGLTQEEVRIHAMMIIAIVGILSIFLAIERARGLVRPIKELMRAVKRVAQGDLRTKARVMTKDEFGKLAESFNMMTHELEKSQKELEEAHFEVLQAEKLATLGLLTDGIMHQLKGPLSGMLAYCEILRTEVKKNDPLYEVVQAIEATAQQCKGITQRLLIFSSKPSDKGKPIEITKAIEGALLITHHLLKHNIELVKEYEEGLPPILGNLNELQQAFIDLILNAVDAMPDGGRLRVEAKRDGDMVMVRIADTGCGIPKENMGKIFTPFFSTKDKERATGLGLSTTYRIVKAHNGTIEVESTVNKGTTFTMRFPSKGGRDDKGCD